MVNVRKSGKMLRIARVSLFAAFISVTSLIQIPIGAVPVTLQLFGIYLALYTLGGIDGTLAVIIYLALGAVGLPVFSGYTGGIGRFFDATGGFIFGFLILALVYTAFSLLLPSGTKARRILPTALSLISLYASGIIFYLCFYLGFSLASFLSLSVSLALPLATDLVKIFLADLVHKRIKINF